MSGKREQSIKKSEHYVPQAYLEMFANGKRISALEKADGYKFVANVTKVASRNSLYETRRSDTSDNDCPKDKYIALNYIENQLSSIEGECIIALRSVCDVATGKVDADEMLLCNTDTILEFAVNTVQRSPYALDELRETVKNVLGEILTRLALDMGAKENLVCDLPALVNECANRIILVDGGMGSLPARIVNQWKGCLRVLAVAPNDAHFITSDLPVLGEGFDNDNLTTLYMPLSPRVSILFDRTHLTGDVRRVEFSREDVDSVNRHFFSDQSRCKYVLGPEEEYLTKLYERVQKS